MVAELFDERDRFVRSEHHGDSVVQVVRGSASFGWQDMQTLLRVVLESAEERVRLTTAYFAFDAYFIGLLCAAARRPPPAARRGMEVEVLLPGSHTDKRVCQLAGQRYYEDLTACPLLRRWEPVAPSAARTGHPGPAPSARARAATGPRPCALR